MEYNPLTGDFSQIWIFVVAGLAAVGLVVLILTRKKK